MEQSRVSVRDSFSKQIKTMPYILNINGENEWVDDYIKFGDLIEEHMGKDARDFYFETIYDLLDNHSVNSDEDIEDWHTEEKPIAKVTTATKQKQPKPVGRRLF